jgi:hypothetical protein
MEYLFGPNWFYGLDIGFELIVMLITLLIAFYSLRIYLVARQRVHIYFTLAFLSIALSYLFRAAIDWVAYRSLLGRMPNLEAAISRFMTLQTLYDTGFFAYIFFAFAGFMILLAVYVGITRYRTVALLLVVVLALAIISKNAFLAFHMILIVMLGYVVYHLFRNYAEKKSTSKFLVLYGFSCLLAAQAFFVLVVYRRIFYIAGHSLQLFGFTMLLLSLVLVLRK